MPGLKARLSRYLPDPLFVTLQQLRHTGRFLNLRNPRTFTDKLQWYKLYYRDPLMTRIADKLEVREYIREKGFAGLLNELYGVFDSVDTIPLASLPPSFVLKATHGSSMNIICRDKRSVDWAASLARMQGWLDTNVYELAREWAYKNIRPRVICEKYLENEGEGELLDYKIFCFDGKPEATFVCTGRYGPGGVRYAAYDLDWQRIHVTKGKPVCDRDFDKPATFPVMCKVASALSKGFPFLRVDFYEVQRELIFGELTLYPDAGLVPFKPDSYDRALGSLFRLPVRPVNFARPDLQDSCGAEPRR